MGTLELIRSFLVNENTQRGLALALLLALLCVALFRSVRLRQNLESLQPNFVEPPKRRGRPATRLQTLLRQRDQALDFELHAKQWVALSALFFAVVALVVPSAVLVVVVREYQWFQFGEAAIAFSDGCSPSKAITHPSLTEVLAFLLNQAPDQFQLSQLPVISEFIPEHFRHINYNAESGPIGFATLVYKLWIVSYAVDGVLGFFPILLRAYLTRSETVRELDSKIEAARKE